MIVSFKHLNLFGNFMNKMCISHHLILYSEFCSEFRHLFMSCVFYFTGSYVTPFSIWPFTFLINSFIEKKKNMVKPYVYSMCFISPSACHCLLTLHTVFSHRSLLYLNVLINSQSVSVLLFCQVTVVSC